MNKLKNIGILVLILIIIILLMRPSRVVTKNLPVELVYTTIETEKEVVKYERIVFQDKAKLSVLNDSILSLSDLVRYHKNNHDTVLIMQAQDTLIKVDSLALLKSSEIIGSLDKEVNALQKLKALNRQTIDILKEDNEKQTKKAKRNSNALKMVGAIAVAELGFILLQLNN